MTSKFALIAALALGLLVGGTATTALAASAGSAQYAPDDDNRLCEENGGVEGENGCEYPCEEGGSGVGEENCAPAPQPPGPPDQGSLPRTGLPVAPALIAGLALLGAGLLMRQRLGAGSRLT